MITIAPDHSAGRREGGAACQFRSPLAREPRHILSAVSVAVHHHVPEAGDGAGVSSESDGRGWLRADGGWQEAQASRLKRDDDRRET